MLATSLRSLLVAAVLATSLPAFAQEKVLSDRILPPKTYLYFSVPSVHDMKAYMKESSFSKMLNDSEMENFKSQVMEAIESEMQEGFAKAQEALGMSMEEMMAIPDGEISIALSTGNSNSLGLVAFFEYGENEDAVSDLLQKASDALSGQEQLTQEDTSFDSTDITYFKIDSPGPNPMNKELGWFQKDGRLVVSNRLPLLEKVLSNWDGEGDSFADSEVYSYIKERCSKEDTPELSVLYVDPINAIQKLINSGAFGPQTAQQAGMMLPMVLQTTGLPQMKAFGSISQSGGDDFESITRSMVYSEQPPVALMRAFQLSEVATVPPEWVKEDAHAFISMNWKIDEAFNAIQDLFDQFGGGQGALEKQLNQMAEQGPRIHIKDDVIDQMTGDMSFVMAAGATSTDSDQTLVSFGIKDTSAFEGVISRMADQAGMDSREFRGSTIYEIETPANSVQLAASENRLLFCVGSTLLEQVLRNDSDVRPLSQTEGFKRIQSHLPANALTVQFSKPMEQYRPVYEMFRDGSAADQLPGMDDIFEMIDFTTLPPFSAVSKYIQPTGGYTVKDENGLYMENFQLRD